MDRIVKWFPEFFNQRHCYHCQEWYGDKKYEKRNNIGFGCNFDNHRCIIIGLNIKERYPHEILLGTSEHYFHYDPKSQSCEMIIGGVKHPIRDPLIHNWIRVFGSMFG